MEESILLAVAELISAPPLPIARGSPSLPVEPILMEREKTVLWVVGSKSLKIAGPALLLYLARASGKQALIEASFLPSRAVEDSSLEMVWMRYQG